MKTFTALIRASIGNSVKAIPVEIRAQNGSDAKWLLQAIYGFHAVVSSPTEIREGTRITELVAPKTSEQIRVDNLKAVKDRAGDALKAERNRQKRSKALKTLSNLNKHNPLGP
jgi:hypothetical protein